jgi:transposase
MKHYAGIDLGQRFHQVAVVDENGQAVRAPFRIGRGRCAVEGLLAHAGTDASQLVVSVEATGSYWHELVGVLRERGCEVYLISPKKGHDLRRFFRAHTKTDVTDAEALARIPLVDGSVRPVWTAPPKTESLLRLCRLRWKYRCRIADIKRRISRLSDTVVPGIDRVMPVRYSKSARLFLRRYLSPEKAHRLGRRRLMEMLDAAAWGKFSDAKQEALWQAIDNAPALGWNGDDLTLEVSTQIDELEMLEQQVERLDERITELYAEVDAAERLKAIPGLGSFLAAAITAHIGDARRFPTGQHVVSYAGLTPRVKHTAGRFKSGQALSKSGSPYLRAWAYLGAANARQYDDDLKRYYAHMRHRGKHYNVAMCATAARLLVRAHELMLSQGGEVDSRSGA